MTEKYYPKEPNIGKECKYWGIDGCAHCCFPKHELNGRTTCQGTIDDVCLAIKDGRTPSTTTAIMLGWPVSGLISSTLLPPGEIE